jgi:hypothetical protein
VPDLRFTADLAVLARSQQISDPADLADLADFLDLADAVVL